MLNLSKWKTEVFVREFGIKYHYSDTHDDYLFNMPVVEDLDALDGMHKPGQSIVEFTPVDITESGENVHVVPTVSIRFDYPLTTSVIHSFSYVDLKKTMLTRRDFWKMINEGYRYIYDNPKRFGVWGHCMNDLVIERVYFEGNIFTLGIGS